MRRREQIQTNGEKEYNQMDNHYNRIENHYNRKDNHYNRMEEPKRFNLYARLVKKSDFNKYQIAMLEERDFKEIQYNPFGRGAGPVYLLKPRFNESLVHALFCFILEEEIMKYTDNVDLYSTKKPDVVVEVSGKKICFEVETGSNLTKHKKRMKAKFKRIQEKYDACYILVKNRELKTKYKKYGKVITRTQIKSTIKSLFE